LANNKLIGTLVFTASLILMAVYTLAIYYAFTITLQITALIAVLGILGALAWIGYTMLTEPPFPEVGDASQLDDLEPETINPLEDERGRVHQSSRSVIVDIEVGEGTILRDQVNLYRCKIGRNCKIESFAYIEEGVTVGDNCKVKPHAYIPSGVVIEDNVFIGPNVTFTNDKYPHVAGDWKLLQTIVGAGASIGAHSVILPGVRIGRNSMVGAGSVVTSDVPDGAVVHGNPARVVGK
jgi:UDP-2-acetamido-3-amino-2,3-dideoxy-glucuronate N-acetyltransferase